MSSGDMFRPPINRAMRELDRSFFQKRIPIAAARLNNPRDIAPSRKALEKSKEILIVPRLQSIRNDPLDGHRKCLLLKPEVRHDDSTTWSSTLRDLVAANTVGLIPYELYLDYSFWQYHDIMSAILPEDLQDDIASGFSQIGHIAHLNLREHMLPYKYLLAEVLLEKTPTVRLVINKTSQVGSSETPPQSPLLPTADDSIHHTTRPSQIHEPPASADTNPFRTFPFEVLAPVPSPDQSLLDLDVKITESNCVFHFDFSKVYWNPRLNTEHSRILTFLRPGEAVLDACAGIGPFAVPAAKKGVYAFANDLNPASAEACREAVRLNHVERFAKVVECTDGAAFVRNGAVRLFNWDWSAEQASMRQEIRRRTARDLARAHQKAGKAASGADWEKHKAAKLAEVDSKDLKLDKPRTFSHFLMNLPSHAIELVVPSFVGLYAQPAFKGVDRDVLRPMPVVHAHCFGPKGELIEEGIAQDAANEVGRRLSCDITAKEAPQGWNGEGLEWLKEGEAFVYDVRDVAPKKRMLCVSFRLPEEVAFRGG